jgi:hypothetical protein
MFSY